MLCNRRRFQSEIRGNIARMVKGLIVVPAFSQMMRLWVTSTVLLVAVACRPASPPRVELGQTVPAKPKATAVSPTERPTAPIPPSQPTSVSSLTSPVLPLPTLKSLPPLLPPTTKLRLRRKIRWHFFRPEFTGTGRVKPCPIAFLFPGTSTPLPTIQSWFFCTERMSADGITTAS